MSRMHPQTDTSQIWHIISTRAGVHVVPRPLRAYITQMCDPYFPLYVTPHVTPVCDSRMRLPYVTAFVTAYVTAYDSRM